ncbi:DUF397 domain-containing protein [Streptomyces sp. NBC_00878]|uniref:DUF397 domain-containing protein n=1 Tax=Streptomyces sp. NBC_00878 TaxID=2975854 RepID=UPI0022599236|nr:DUF397 domain-containing protein [Streptomyces sp. NBC_00878]MCX4908876.1 DUF397 domain-containing protein [Streptomyces sp. NBC_00878]
MPIHQFRKSTYSDTQGECVEVATNIPTTIAIRDSKHPTGPSLRVRPATWEAFQTVLADGSFTTPGWNQ